MAFHFRGFRGGRRGDCASRLFDLAASNFSWKIPVALRVDDLAGVAVSKLFRVVDLTNNEEERETTVEGVRTPEEAAKKALGLDLVRSGAKRMAAAKVYWQDGQATSMLRLYLRLPPEESR